ncbi:MAG: hypothetical protein ABI910_18885 [Gemmatimonadota bacterium]
MTVEAVGPGTDAAPPTPVHRLGCVSFSAAGLQVAFDGVSGGSLDGVSSMPARAPRSSGVRKAAAKSGGRGVTSPSHSSDGATTASDQPFTNLLKRMTPFLRSQAWRLAPGDHDLQEDLKQEGRIALWQLEPVRLAAARSADGYRRATIHHAMKRYLRVLGRQVPGEVAIRWDVVEEVLDRYKEKEKDRAA